MTGIPLGTLSKILAGISDSPKLVNIVAIADALDCSVDYLISGVAANNNNYTLSADEIAFIEKYRSLDGYGQELVRLVTDKELGRVDATTTPEVFVRSERKSAKILDPVPTAQSSKGLGKRTIMLYDLPVSAGPGVYLDDSTADTISIINNEKTQMADFALRISGNSMEPKYHDGDVLLVEHSDSVEVGELGIFVLDGNGYFKKYGGDTLISLNPEYGDIVLKEYAEAVCCGRVVGRLKKR